MAIINRSDLLDPSRQALLCVGADPQDAQRPSELGYHPRRIAGKGLIAVAAANSPALMSLGGAPAPILGANPIAYGIPRPGQQPIVIDQAGSSTAFVNIRRAAEGGEPIPAGWALGPDGEPTRDATAALHGTLLPFGGYRGGNIALLVEILAPLSGDCFSIDAPPFDKDATSPGIGLFVPCIDASSFPGSGDRLTAHIESLRTNQHVRLPAVETTSWADSIDISDDALRQLHDASRPR